MDATNAEHVDATHTPPADAPVDAGAELIDRVGRLEAQLRETQGALRTAETRARIHRALGGAGAVDVDAVAMVVEAALGNDGAPDQSAVARTVEELRRTRPALFKSPGASRSTAMTVRVERPPARSPLEDAAHQAARTGDRASLLNYLRLRRTTTA